MNRILFIIFPLVTVLVASSCKQDTPTSNKQVTDAVPVVKRESWKNAGCDLLTDQEVERIFNFDGKATFLNTRSLPDQTFCLRTWKKVDWMARESANEKNMDGTWLNPENRLVIQLFDYTSEEHAKLQMEGLRRDRRNTYEEDVAGVGDDGLWSTSTETLLVKKGQYVVNITLEVVDVPHDNLLKSKEVAAVIAAKL